MAKFQPSDDIEYTLQKAPSPDKGGSTTYRANIFGRFDKAIRESAARDANEEKRSRNPSLKGAGRAVGSMLKGMDSPFRLRDRK